TAFAFWVAALSISGFPLFNGFVSKGMVLMAAEHTSIWIWVLLEIASFGTFVSFLKLGYFAFLRRGDTPASDPPLLMQAGMLGTAAFCIIFGVFPTLLFAILPYPTGYVPFAPIPVASAFIVLGAAALFFFTIGRRILEPHDTRLKDFDTLYIRAGEGLVSLAGGIEAGFRQVYSYAVSTAGLLFFAGRTAGGMENRTVNWNIAVFTAVVIAFMMAVMLGVGM
ncbi:MAG: hypothetical protein LUQ25_05715, partial [Methanoregulaceae archaeon]|nr:hypothetical protein [Methanoregulaceae archaeon]